MTAYPAKTILNCKSSSDEVFAPITYTSYSGLMDYTEAGKNKHFVYAISSRGLDERTVFALHLECPVWTVPQADRANRQKLVAPREP
jgi:hypothetical protein